MISQLIEQLPLWAVFVTTVLVASACVELGYQLGLVRRQRAAQLDDETRINAMTGAQLALMGFLLAFSFNLAAGHHAERRHLVLDEVNAIETAWLRAELIDPALGGAIQKRLQDYVALRAAVQRHPSDLEKIIADTEALQLEIWSRIDALADQPGFGARESLLVRALNQVFDLHSERKFAALQTRIPRSIWTMLFVVLSLSLFGLGYFSGIKGRRSAVTRTSLTLSLSMIIFLIADLDRPGAGLVRGDQGPMVAYHEQLLQR